MSCNGLRPVLPDEREGGHGPAPSGRPPSGSCWRSRAGPRWPLRSAVATSRGVRAQGPVVVSLQSRRCSCRAGTSCSRPASTSRAAIRNGRFSSVHQWPDLRVHRGPECRVEQQQRSEGSARACSASQGAADRGLPCAAIGAPRRDGHAPVGNVRSPEVTPGTAPTSDHRT